MHIVIGSEKIEHFALNASYQHSDTKSLRIYVYYPMDHTQYYYSV